MRLPVIELDEKTEDLIYDLYEIYKDLLVELDREEKDPKKIGEHLIIQTRNLECIILSSEEVSNLPRIKEEEAPI